jgi:tRNA-specific 2-thiouridylase
MALGFDAVCTGHYARIEDGVNGPALLRAVDPDKDQSYVLAVLNKDQLSRAMFPLGDSLKSDVRAEARERGLLVADKADSHDICFIPDGDTRGFLARNLGTQTGDIVATDGRVLGSHEGTFGFTVGQRKGLGLREAAPDRAPRYVLSIEPVSNTVMVGSQEQLAVTGLAGAPVTWCGDAPAQSFECDVQVRAHGESVPATASVTQDKVDLALHSPQRGVAPGQAAVMFDGARVIGSVTIASTQHPESQHTDSEHADIKTAN